MLATRSESSEHFDVVVKRELWWFVHLLRFPRTRFLAWTWWDSRALAAVAVLAATAATQQCRDECSGEGQAEYCRRRSRARCG